MPKTALREGDSEALVLCESHVSEGPISHTSAFKARPRPSHPSLLPTERDVAPPLASNSSGQSVRTTVLCTLASCHHFCCVTSNSISDVEQLLVVEQPAQSQSHAHTAAQLPRACLWVTVAWVVLLNRLGQRHGAEAIAGFSCCGCATSLRNGMCGAPPAHHCHDPFCEQSFRVSFGCCSSRRPSLSMCANRDCIHTSV